MGIIIILSMIGSYLIAIHFIQQEETVVLITAAITSILLILAYLINYSFEKIAEAAIMKSEFVEIVSHQLRSPITNLGYVIDLLISGKFEEKKNEYLMILKENNQRIKELISNLVIVSKIETNSLVFKKEPVFLKDLIENLISQFTLFAQASNVKIEFFAQENLPKISTDPAQLKIVIENLLDNAIRYIKEKGGIKIKLEKRKREIFFEIKDNGVGIPKEDQKYIFQKFFRSENIKRLQTQGSGLGLYISKKIIEKLGGKIGFKSEEGKGSTFWFTLPI
jgi:signal transduction histidine kinase